MDYDTAIGRKEEILLRLPSMTAVRGGEPPPIGIGLALSDVEDDFGIAVRPRYQGDLTETARQYLERASNRQLDIQATGDIEPTGLTVGCTTAHYKGRAGTLGFFARRMRDGVMGFVSANHVIAALDAGMEGDEVVQPAPFIAGTRGPSDRIGVLDGNYPRLLRQPELCTVDCAFARLIDGIEYEASSIGSGEVLRSDGIRPRERLPVSKVGSASSRTFGRIRTIALDGFAVDYWGTDVKFRDQIEIESLDDSPFSRPGDSGSVVFTADYQPIGLVFARSAAGGHANAGLTFVNPIAAVLKALDVSFVA
ncbi:MAG TPA: hypothetical protein VKB93_28505 [Thermoanaerobaculia bacterium]|nr:hypothetical protein [Thermoanaerobaculia bacterium]